MTFAAATLRLSAFLLTQQCVLTLEQHARVSAILDPLLSGYDLPTLKKAVHAMRQALRHAGGELKQSQAFEAVAAYLGHRDWNTARAAAGSFTSASAPPVRFPVEHTVQGQRYLGYAFEIAEKGPGVAHLHAGLQALTRAFGVPCAVRLLSRPTPETVGHTGARRDLSPVIATLQVHRRQALGAAQTTCVLPGQTAPLRTVRHYLGVVFPDFSVEQGAVVALRQAKEVQARLEAWLGCELAPTACPEVQGLYALSEAPDGARAWQRQEGVRACGAAWLAAMRDTTDLASFFDFSSDEQGTSLCRYGLVPTRPLDEKGWAVVVSRAREEGYRLLPLAPVPQGDTAALMAESWLTDAKPRTALHGIPFLTRAGNLENLDLFAGEFTAPVLVLSGSAGSGKTTLANEILVQALSRGQAVRVLDEGYSYRKFAQLFEGQFKVLTPEAPVPLNPFQGVSQDSALPRYLPLWTDTVLELLSADRSHATGVTRCIEAAWRSCRANLQASDIVQALARDVAAEMKTLGQQLYALVTEHPGWFATRDGAMADTLLVYEIEDLRSRPALMRIVVILILAGWAHEALETPAPKVYLVDETWCLHRQQSAEFASAMLQAMQSKRHAFAVAMQSFFDCEVSAFLHQILEQSSHVFSLPCKPEGLEWLRTRSKYRTLFPSPEEIHGEGGWAVFATVPEALRAAVLANSTWRVGLKTGAGREALLKATLRGIAEVARPDRGQNWRETQSARAGRHFSEVAVLTPQRMVGVLRLSLDRFSRLAYTLRPQEMLRYHELVDGGCSPRQALEQQFQEQPE